MKKIAFLLFCFVGIAQTISANKHHSFCLSSEIPIVLKLERINPSSGQQQGPRTPIQINASAYLSNGYIYVDATCYSGMTLDVYVEDEDGITYSYSTHDASSTFAVDVTSLSSGTYYLRLRSDDLSYDLIGEFEIE